MILRRRPLRPPSSLRSRRCSRRCCYACCCCCACCSIASAAIAAAARCCSCSCCCSRHCCCCRSSCSRCHATAVAVSAAAAAPLSRRAAAQLRALRHRPRNGCRRGQRRPRSPHRTRRESAVSSNLSLQSPQSAQHGASSPPGRAGGAEISRSRRRRRLRDSCCPARADRATRSPMRARQVDAARVDAGQHRRAAQIRFGNAVSTFQEFVTPCSGVSPGEGRACLQARYAPFARARGSGGASDDGRCVRSRRNPPVARPAKPREHYGAPSHTIRRVCSGGGASDAGRCVRSHVTHPLPHPPSRGSITCFLTHDPSCRSDTCQSDTACRTARCRRLWAGRTYTHTHTR